MVREVLDRLAPGDSLLYDVASIVIDALPELPSAADVAQRLGLRSRFALSRHLRHEGHPPFVVIRGQVWAMFSLARHQISGLSLDQLAASDGRRPSGYYARVREITGETWGDWRRRRISGGYRALAQRAEEECEDDVA